jgi:hypothetical protein
MRTRATKVSNERTHGFHGHFFLGDGFNCYTATVWLARHIKLAHEHNVVPRRLGPLRSGRRFFRFRFPFSGSVFDLSEQDAILSGLVYRSPQS